MEVIVAVDCREDKLRALLPVAQVRQLDVGDVNLSVGEELSIVLERKTLADLAASIVDGRWKEQRARCLAALGGRERDLVYVIEGDVGWAGDNKTPITQAVHTSLLSLQLAAGCSLFCVRSVEETAALVGLLAGYVARRRGEDGRPGPASYEGLIRPKKAENMSPRNIAIAQLALVPRVSAAAAARILSATGHETVGQLVAGLAAMSEEDRLKSLASVRVTDKGRQLGRETAGRLWRALAGDGAQKRDGAHDADGAQKRDGAHTLDTANAGGNFSYGPAPPSIG